ncbi:amyloid protein-binding protein 2 [Lingula anatina]|uniref:Amyloid protein-binding protein 2 n=1 Tax=Lingula anatina TaxID=7574 RepID=A0A1S3I798_LINAN|nr:amyloid protein-binding protein 2-like [Lingula anatina]XP_013394127.1 amyloid protein-binding protein 2 [Lingula anatina]|eukprot:XP_013379692.1 amyloid protein-binding protein 2-like [Lingula anatina]
MAASALEWVPDSLFNTAISIVVKHYSKFRRELKTLPENVQFDVYYKLYSKGRLCQLGLEFSELDIFAGVLKVNDKRHLLHHCFQALMDHGVRTSETLCDAYRQMCCVRNHAEPFIRDKTLKLGLLLGGFLSEAGWFVDSENVILSCLQMCKQREDTKHWYKALECCVRLMHIRNANCKYVEAEQIYVEARTYLDKLSEKGIQVNKSALHTEICALLFAKSQYDEAYHNAMLALKELNSSLPAKTIVDVLRQSAKACVVKREFKKAELLVKHAVYFAKEFFGTKHPKYSDALLDYGFYLLNVDSICQAVQVYQAALDIRQSVFGGNNLHVAVAHEDLAYATYVHEYSSGKFSDAREHAEKAIKIITSILPEDHLLLASSKRVKALILEEIAIDSHNKEIEERLLQESQDLHLASLALAKKAFGENNVQTAKHYGNLGRLYQSMHRYQEAEEMHQKAIEIKERLLGSEDYEVALSVGHLASLYNYDMKKYPEAEQLYLRSIAVGKKLFGSGYSGLEYDYRGLLRLYHSLGDTLKSVEYSLILQEWNQIRDRTNQEEIKPLDFERPLEDTTLLVKKFFEL